MCKRSPVGLPSSRPGTKTHIVLKLYGQISVLVKKPFLSWSLRDAEESCTLVMLHLLTMLWHSICYMLWRSICYMLWHSIISCCPKVGRGKATFAQHVKLVQPDLAALGLVPSVERTKTL